MYAPERQAAIAARVGRESRVAVSDLALEHGVTTETVRHDLAVLERAGVLRRVHGGAISASALALPEPRVEERDRVRPTTQAAGGADAVPAVEELRVDVAVTGTNGFSADGGLTTPDGEEAAVRRALVRCARRVVVLADAGKAGRQDLHRFARLEEVDVLVTDSGLDEPARRDDRAALAAADVDVVVA